MTILQDTAVCIPTTGNQQALLISLTAILQGLTLPRKILIRSEGHFPAFANFYLEQLSDVARQRGVEFQFAVTPSKGLRYAVDWLLDNCGVNRMWLVADDVLPDVGALTALHEAVQQLESSIHQESRLWGYVCGLKQDVNNRRGWPDYSQPDPVAAHDYCPTYGNYTATSPMVVRNRLLDNSHAMFNVREINSRMLMETAFTYGFQSGGDDTLFGLRIINEGLGGWFCPLSRAFHLEKEAQNFNEPTARAESLLRQLQLLNINNSGAVNQMFGYCRKYGSFPPTS